MPTTTLTILLICETLKLLLMMILLICETLRLLTLTRKQQRIPRARQQGREVQEGHAECCQPQARPQVLQGPEVQGVLEAPEVLDGLVRRCDHPARIHQPDPETRRHQGCLAGLSGQAGLQDRIGHRGRGLQEHREGLVGRATQCDLAVRACPERLGHRECLGCRQVQVDHRDQGCPSFRLCRECQQDREVRRCPARRRRLEGRENL